MKTERSVLETAKVSLRGVGVALLLAVPSQLDAQTAVLDGIVRDETTGAPVPCTVSIRDSAGKLVLEGQSFQKGFRCNGRFRKELVPGRTTVRVTRGFETQSVEEQIDLVAGTATEMKISVRRNIDMPDKGWYGGDSHVHMLHGERTWPVSFDFVAETAEAEDLRYMSLAQAWQIESATPESLTAALQKRSTSGCTLTWNLEAPKNYYKGDAGRCLGHCWNLGMRGRTTEGADVIKALLDASAWDYESEKRTFANFESHELVHEQGGAVFYTHPMRWWMGEWGGRNGFPKREQMRVSNMAVELPLDTIAGPTFDGLDVITGPGEFEANDKAFRLWSMLLNQGYRLAATGSSDACFDRPGGAIPGVSRTYSFVPNGFSIAKVTKATALGRTFATTGPLLLASMDGQPPGSAFRLTKKQHRLAIEGWASGEFDQGLGHLEVLRNGQPYLACVWSEHPTHIQTNCVIHEEERAWYCVRLFGEDEKKQRAITSAFYFGPYVPPPPATARVHATIVDAESGQNLSGVLREIRYAGTLARVGKAHRFSHGETLLEIGATMRLQAEAPGHASLVLSPVVDNPSLMGAITSLSEDALLDWKTFERMRQELSQVDLEFRLERK